MTSEEPETGVACEAMMTVDVGSRAGDCETGAADWELEVETEVEVGNEEQDSRTRAAVCETQVEVEVEVCSEEQDGGVCAAVCEMESRRWIRRETRQQAKRGERREGRLCV